MPFDIAISVDGPTASGKTTLAYRLAADLRAYVLDTGLTYRAVAYATMRQTMTPSPDVFASRIRHLAGAPGPPPGGPTIVYHDEDITDAIWSSDVEKQVRVIATDSRWRYCIDEYHQLLLRAQPRAIAIGRDCAHTIMANASCHVFLTATQAVRRERRRAQSRHQQDRAVFVGPATDLDERTRQYVRTRPNGFVLDTTFLPIEASVRAVLLHLGEMS